MAYATSNPPRKVAQSNGSLGISIWTYNSADAIATVQGAGYFSNAGDLGMGVGDMVWSHDSNLVLTTVNAVSAVTAGAATVVAA